MNPTFRLETQPAPQGELFEHLVESSTDFAIYTASHDGTATSWNIGAGRLFSYLAADIIGSSADVIATEEDQAAGEPRTEREEAARHGRAANERWHRRRDGSRSRTSGSLVPLRNPEDGFVKIVRDRTKVYRANEEGILPLDGAVLDINLRDERVHPVAEALAARGVPFVFATGHDSAAIPAPYSSAPRCGKPVDRAQLARALARIRSG